MKVIYVLIAALIPIAFVSMWAGFYPVVWLDGNYILAARWEKAQKAAKSFAIAEAQSVGEKPPTFTEGSRALQEIKRNTLTFLIEDLILQDAGEGLIRGFKTLARQKISEVTAKSNELDRAAELVYGLEPQEFHDLVLMPQARQDTARELLAERQIDLEPWFIDKKKNAKVRLLFTPFTWDGEAVK